MKNIFFSMVILCLPLSIFCQPKSIEQFYNKYKGMEEVTSINLSGQLINMVFTSADPETGELASKISQVRLLIVEEGAVVKGKDYKQFLKNVKKDDFEELIRFKDGGDAIDFHLKEESGTITNVLITVRGDDGFVLLSLEGLFKFSDLNDFNLDIEGAEYLKRLPEKKKEIDRA